jgi:hypothetical protein
VSNNCQIFTHKKFHSYWQLCRKPSNPRKNIKLHTTWNSEVIRQQSYKSLQGLLFFFGDCILMLSYIPEPPLISADSEPQRSVDYQWHVPPLSHRHQPIKIIHKCYAIAFYLFVNSFAAKISRSVWIKKCCFRLYWKAERHLLDPNLIETVFCFWYPLSNPHSKFHSYWQLCRKPSNPRKNIKLQITKKLTPLGIPKLFANNHITHHYWCCFFFFGDCILILSYISEPPKICSPS